MNTVGAETSTLFPDGVIAQRVVERDQDGRLVHIVAVDYQMPGRDLGEVARTYAALRGADVAVAA